MSEEQSMPWRPSFAVLKRADDNIITDSSYNTWLNKQCMSSPPKVPISSVFYFHACVCWIVALYVFAHKKEGEKKNRRWIHAYLWTYMGTPRHSQTEILYAAKQAMDSRLMYLCCNGLKLKQDEKGLHFRGAALLLMTRGPPTAISAYYNFEIALLCF